MKSLKPVLRSVLLLFAALSAVGLVVSLAIHVLALAGIPAPILEQRRILTIGMLLVWVPAALASGGGDVSPRERWRAAFAHCPVWMKYMTYFFFGYGLLSFAAYLVVPRSGASGRVSAIEIRAMSIPWLILYSAALSILYSAANRKYPATTQVTGR